MYKNAVAIIDLGSNSIRMDIVDIGKHRAEILEEYRDTVRISKGMSDDGNIKQEAFFRTAEVLKTFKHDMAEFGVVKVVAVATEALRKARNASGFIEHINRETGILFEIISGVQEAQYVFGGVSSDPELWMVSDGGDYVLMDTGGGSCEVMRVVKGVVLDVVSLPLGGVVLSEKYLESDVISSASLFNLFGYISEVFGAVSWLNECRSMPLIAIGGSNKAVRKILKSGRLVASDVDMVYESLLKADLVMRKRILKKNEDRADIIIGGLAPLVYLTHSLNTNEIYISKKGIKDGILAELMKNGGDLQ